MIKRHYYGNDECLESMIIELNNSIRRLRTFLVANCGIEIIESNTSMDRINQICNFLNKEGDLKLEHPLKINSYTVNNVLETLEFVGNDESCCEIAKTWRVCRDNCEYVWTIIERIKESLRELNNGTDLVVGKTTIGQLIPIFNHCCGSFSFPNMGIEEVALNYTKNIKESYKLHYNENVTGFLTIPFFFILLFLFIIVFCGRPCYIEGNIWIMGLFCLLFIVLIAVSFVYRKTIEKVVENKSKMKEKVLSEKLKVMNEWQEIQQSHYRIGIRRMEMELNLKEKREKTKIDDDIREAEFGRKLKQLSLEKSIEQQKNELEKEKNIWQKEIQQIKDFNEQMTKIIIELISK